MQPNLTPLRLSHGVGDILFGTLHCERRLAGAVVQVTKPEDNTAICDITLQGSASECCTAVLQILHHASAAYSQNSDLSSGMFAQPAWQFTHQDQQEVLSTNQLTQLPLDAFAPDAPCLHLPSSCFLTLPLAVQCCQLLTLGQGPQAEQQAVPGSQAEELEDTDGDVVMAEEYVEQLVASLQNARNASGEWDSSAGPASISMLLFGHQATAEQEPTPMDFAITKPGAVRLYVVLDTSILLSHWSFIQAFHRNLGQDGAVPSDQAGSPAVQLLLVVPWAVLVELDKLKEEQSVLRIQGGKRDVAPLARRAIKGLASLLIKGRSLQYQSEADALQADKQYGAKGKKVVNDDSIIHCGMNVQRRMHEAHLQGDLEASKSGAVLLSKDYNMCLKAQANGLKALTPTQFPAAQPHLHKHLLAISSETSPVKHSPAQDTSPPPPPKALSDLPLTPRQGAAALPTGASRPALTPGQSQAAPGSATALSASGKHSHPSESTSNGKSFVYPADRLAQQGAKKQSAQTSSSHQQQQNQQTQAQQLQQQLLQQLSQQQHGQDSSVPQQHQHQQQQQQQKKKKKQQGQQQAEELAVGSFKLQGAPVLSPGLVTGSHGYPTAPASSSTPLQPSFVAPGGQQAGSGLLQGFATSKGSMQHQQGGFPGNLLHSLPYNGNSLTPSTSIRDQRLLPSQTSDSAVGLSSSSSVDTAQELSERVWGLLVEGLQPYMQWELQSGMGDLWDQAVSVRPPWNVADMMAVMKKDMSGTLHSNAELSRCHSRLAAALKGRDRPTSLSAVADLASNVSSVLLMLPLPAKIDKVAHVKSGAVTGLEAHLALQRGREEAQQLHSKASAALKQQQQQQLPRSASFPPKGAPKPIGPSPHTCQAMAGAGAGNSGQGRSVQPIRNGRHSPSESSSSLDRAFSGGQLYHARQHVSEAASPSQGFPAHSSWLSNQAVPHNIWQQQNLSQGTISSEPYGESAVSDDLLARHQSGNVMDLLQSAQGLLQVFGRSAAEHLTRCKVQLQQHPADAPAVHEAVNIIADAARLLVRAIAMVHAAEPPQHQVEVVKQCAQNMLLVVFWTLDQQQAPPAVKAALVTQLCYYFNDPERAHAAANVSQRLQNMAQSIMSSYHS